MCLNRITMKVENPSLEEKTVYKIFELIDGEINFQYKTIPNFLIKTDEWITALAQTVSCDLSADSYETGFHCYLSETDALENYCGRDERDEVVKKVIVREITYYGTQHEDEIPCLVARQMLIPSDSEQKEEDKKEK